MGPIEFVQAVHVAREYYLAGRSKVEIATELGLSRYKVARILDAARAAGVVRIEIGSAGLIDAELSDRLRNHLGLAHCLVATVGDDADSDGIRQAIGAAAAGLLTEVVSEQDVVGIAWGRSIVAAALALSQLSRTPLVQLTGITGHVGQTPIDLLRRFAAVSRGSTFPIYAPLVMPDESSTRTLRSHPAVQAAISRFGLITVAVVAVGSWDSEGSQLYAALQAADRSGLDGRSVAAEICAMLIDHDGNVLHTDLDGRTIAIRADELRAVPEIIAIAGGEAKTGAIHAVVRAGLTTSLVTDDVAARHLLELPSIAPRTPTGVR